MATANEETTLGTEKLVETIAGDACLNLFGAYGVTLGVVDAMTAVDGKLLLTAVIGFTGPALRGTCILASTELPLRQSNPTSGSLRDWIAELSNQLVGRIKNQLLRRGAEVYVTTPVVMRGEHLAAPNRFVLQPQTFAVAEGGNVFLWVEVEADPQLSLATVGETAPAQEGETLLF